MPSPTFSYPSPRPVPFTLDTAAIQDAAAAALAHVPMREPERVAFETARIHLTGRAQLALDGGKLRLTSPRSHDTYLCTRVSCTCQAGKHGRYCWHRAAAALIRSIWDRARPLVRCPHCYGPMVAAHTHAGERSVQCLVCAHELLFGAVEVLGLAAWYEPAAQKAA